MSDNPVFFPEEGKVIHGGNFFGQQVAFAADALNLALTQLANLAELPPVGTVVIVAPLKLAGGTGSPTRALALVGA